MTDGTKPTPAPAWPVCLLGFSECLCLAGDRCKEPNCDWSHPETFRRPDPEPTHVIMLKDGQLHLTLYSHHEYLEKHGWRIVKIFTIEEDYENDAH